MLYLSKLFALTITVCLIFSSVSLNAETEKLNQAVTKKPYCDDPELCNNLMRKVKKYATNGSPKAQLYLAVAYLNGDNIEQSNRKAMKWIKKAARNPYPKAHRVISGWYRNGYAGVIDIEKADYFLDLAATAGDTKSIIALGSIKYNQGNLPKAKEMFTKAAKKGSSKAKRMLELLIMEEQGITEQVAAVEKTQATKPTKEQLRVVDQRENVITVTSSYSPVELLTIFIEDTHPMFKTNVTTGSRLPGVKCGMSAASSPCRSYLPERLRKNN
jgi:tetratricopeptide (TPR) repeat protein